jgi:glycogen synthase
MRILMTADTIGGVWSFALELCAALDRHGVEVALATLGQPLSRSQLCELAELENVVPYESSFRLEWMPDPWNDLEEAGRWLLALEREIAPDVVHLNHLVHAELSWKAPVLTVGHSCVFSWWAAVRGTPTPDEWSLYREHVTASLRSADTVVAPTRAMLTQLQRYYGPFKASSVIFNARNARAFRSRTKDPFVLTAGRLWDDAKNVRTLAAIAPSVNWPIYVAGAAEGPEGSVACVPGLRALGHLQSSELASWYGRAPIYALPARYEPFGLTALEAALSGCALVLGDIDSLREVWGNAARYVAPDDLDAWCDEINALIADALARRELAARAAARANAFSPDRLAREYHALYRTLLNNKGTERPAHVRMLPEARVSAAVGSG